MHISFSYHARHKHATPQDVIIGVMQMVNKSGTEEEAGSGGSFTESDEKAFKTFSVYCGLALHHAKLYDKIRRSEQKLKASKND